MKLVEYKERIYNINWEDERFITICLKTMDKYYKKCFDLYSLKKDNIDELEKIAYDEGISVEEIKENANNYYILSNNAKNRNLNKIREYLKPLFKKYDKYTDRKIVASPVNLIFLLLMEEKNSDNIIRLISNVPEIKPTDLRDRVSSFVLAYFKDKKLELMESLRRKVNIYLEYAKEQEKIKKEQQEIEERKKKEIEEQEEYIVKKEILENFIIGEYDSIQEYCFKYLIDVSIFEKIVIYAKKYDKNTYQKYEKILEIKRNQEFKQIMEKVNLMINYIENNIEYEENNTRPFDLIDYYLMFNMDFDSLYKIVKVVGISSRGLRTLKSFMTKHRLNIKAKPEDITKILCPTTKQIIAGREIILEEKELVITYLNKNNIPANNYTYNTVLKRYLNKSLQLEEQNKVKPK